MVPTNYIVYLFNLYNPIQDGTLGKRRRRNCLITSFIGVTTGCNGFITICATNWKGTRNVVDGLFVEETSGVLFRRCNVASQGAPGAAL